MGTWIKRNYIEIAEKSFDNGIIKLVGYNEINDELINEIINNETIQVIQVSKELPNEAYEIIDSILEKRSNLYFRIYGLYGKEKYDISFLRNMPHLKRLILNCHLRKYPNLIDFNVIKDLNLKSLTLDAFDLHDYSFLQYLNDDIEELKINADTMGKTIIFDCKWLLQYKELHTLWLGKKAKKNISCLSKMHSLKSLSLRGIKLTSFDFIKELELEKFELLWNSNNDLHELKELTTLKQIGLWRINKLDNIDFLSQLVNLEVIKLQDLKHVEVLPDLSKLVHLKQIVLDNTGIKIDELDEATKKIVNRYWR